MNLDAKIEELRRLHEAATPGEWSDDPEGAPPWFILLGDPRDVNAKTIGRIEDGDDAAFVLAAHNALPALLAELAARGRKLAAVERLRDYIRDACVENRETCSLGSTRVIAVLNTLDDLLAAEGGGEDAKATN